MRLQQNLLIVVIKWRSRLEKPGLWILGNHLTLLGRWKDRPKACCVIDPSRNAGGLPMPHKSLS